MWWERWIPESSQTKSSVCGVECLIDEAGVSFHYAILQIEKKKVKVFKSGITLNVSEILKLVKKTSSVVILSINGKGVIIKKIIFSENDSLELDHLVQQHLPTIPAQEFYVQFYKNNAGSGHLSICRKEVVNTLLQQFSQEKTECTDVFIGPLVANALAGITSSYNRLSTNVHQLDLVNGFVEAVYPVGTNESQSFQVGELQIEATQTIAFASGFHYLTRQSVYTSSNSELNELSKKHQEKLKLKILSITFIVFIFLISAINSVLFFQKFEEDSKLEVELNLYESKNTQITQLLEDYQKKKSLIEQAGIFDGKKISVYADKIAASLPQDIVLRELYFNPEEGETEEDSLMDFKQNQLIIKGNCNKSLLLNDWVNVLKSQNFVKSVNLENFVFNSEGHLPNFVLKLETE